MQTEYKDSNVPNRKVSIKKNKHRHALSYECENSSVVYEIKSVREVVGEKKKRSCLLAK